MLLTVGNIAVIPERPPDRSKATAPVITGVGEARIFGPDKRQRAFPTGSRLVLDGDRAHVIVPGEPVCSYLCPALDRQVVGSAFNLEGQPRVTRVTNTIQQAMIGRCVRYRAVATTTEPITQMGFTYAGPTTAWETASAGDPVDDWAANERYTQTITSSWTNGTGAPQNMAAMALANATSPPVAGTTYSIIADVYNVPAGDTVAYTWTQHYYGGGTIYATKDGIRYLSSYFYFAGNSVPSTTFSIAESGVEKIGPKSWTYDPTTALADFSSTTCKFYANNVQNDSGGSITADAIWAYCTGGHVIAKTTISPGVAWAAGDYKDIENIVAFQDGTP